MTDGSHATGRDRGLLVRADGIHSLSAMPDVASNALLIRYGRVVALGDADVLRGRHPDCDTLDLTGCTLTPGLTDAHIHLTEWAMARRQVDLSDAASPTAAAEFVARHVAGTHRADTRDDGPWVQGRGWNAHAWHGAGPHRAILDAVLPDRPVALQSHDMHALWVNTAALRMAGIDATTSDPEGGRIERDANGEPTGVLLETAGRGVTGLMPVPGTAALAAAVTDAQHALHRMGITGVHSFPGVHFPDPEPLAVLLALRDEGRLRTRILQHIRVERLDDAIGLGLRSGFGDEWLRIGGVKMFLDGALGSRTAWMREPYEDGSGCGINTLDAVTFRRHVQRAAAAGIATTVHAIGDAAVCLALDVLSDPALPPTPIPHRIEHLQCCPVERLADAAAAGIVCSMQPCHLMTDWQAADAHWGAQRNRGVFAFASLLHHGTTLAFGSDAPVEPVDPRRSLVAAVVRQDQHQRPTEGWYPEERIDMLAALHGFTTGPAAAAGLMAPHGTLAPGAPADIAAWDLDPCADAGAVANMKCMATIVGGAVVQTA